MGRCLGLVLALCCLAGAVQVSALYEKDGPVAQLTQRTWNRVTNSQLPVVVEFYAPWCGHCKALAPAFTRAAEKLRGIVPFVAVDCDAEKNRPLCGQHGVEGFPTIKLFKHGKASATDYMGERSAKALVEAAAGMLTAKHIKRVGSDAEAANFLAGADLPKVLLFSSKAQPSDLYKSLSTRFQSKLAFAEVGTGASSTAEDFGVASRPTLVVVGADGQRHTYSGDLKAQALIDYLKAFAKGGAPQDKAKPKEEPSHEEEGEEAGQQGGSSKGQQQGGEREKEVQQLPAMVKNVTLAELEAAVLAQEGVTLLAFYAGGDEACAAKLTQLNAAVHGLMGLSKGVQVHLSSPEEVAAAAKQFELLDAQALAGEGCAMQVFLLPFDDKDETDEWKKFEGELSSRELHKALLEVFPASFVTPVTAATAQAFMMEDPTAIKVLLFTDKPEAPGVLRALSANFKPYKMAFGMVPSSDDTLMKQFNVPKVPFLVTLFPKPEGADGPAAAGAGARGGDAGAKGGVPIAIQPYQGPMKYAYIARFLQLVALQLGAAPKEVMEELLGEMQQGQQAQHGAGGADPVPQLSSQEDFKAACLDRGGLCIIAALPPLPPAEAEGQEQQQAAGAEGEAGEGKDAGSDSGTPAAPSHPHLDALRAAATRRGGAASQLPLHFAWLDASQHRGFARALGVADPGVAPAVVALSPRKQRYAVLPGAVTAEQLEEFVSGLLSGKVTTVPLQAIPELVAESEEAEEEVAVVEEEFDLADIMKEEVEGELASAKEERLRAEAEAAAKAAEGAKPRKKKKKGKKGGSSGKKDEL